MIRRFVQMPVAFLLAGLLVAAPRARSAEPQQPASRSLPIENIYDDRDTQVETVADSLEYQKEQKKVIAKGNVVITHGSEKITADYAEVDRETKLAFAKGHVIVFQGESAVAKGEEIYYDFGKHSGNFPQGSLISYPWHCTGSDLKKVNQDTATAVDAVFTTCKGDKPPYEVHAKKVTIHDNDKMVARNVTIYSMGRPIFWWPYLVVPLQNRSMPFSVVAGYNDKFGAYVETKKGYSINRYLWGHLLADVHGKRGFGGGSDLSYDFGQYAHGEIRGYWTQDKEAPVPGGENPFSQTENRDRGRLSWWHRTDFDEYSNIQLRYHRLADEVFLQDFFEKEFRSEIEPQSFVTLTKNSPNYGFLVHATKKMNTFETLVEKLPEVRFDWKNQPLGIVPNVYYQNQTSYANLAKRYSRASHNEDVQRFDHFSEWSMPMKVKDIKVTPFLNARGTYYSREAQSDDDHFRTVGGWGLDVRNQYYKTFETQFDVAGIEVNRLRHVIEPYVTYEAFRSSVSDEKLDHFDQIDTIDDQDVVTLGFENRLQTKRVVRGRMQRVDLVSYNTYLSMSPNPGNVEKGASLITLGQEIVLRPYDWLQYELRYEHDFIRSEPHAFTQDFILRKGEKIRLLFGERLAADTVESEGTHQFVFEGLYTLNDRWKVGGYIRWEAVEMDLEEWQVTATRDFDCLLLDFGYNVRNSSIRSGNKELFFNLRLKHYPNYALRGGSNRASFSEPRIGETVNGANQFGRSMYAQDSLGPP
ncbi:MAG TPA: LPS assembly protein LptD [Verrucomicrobiae bacterium]|jgi:hypothetical protein|nr:LPS assembly protein LptD [Verrucomicrobiae bacterium]